ncbi:MAG: hypothetical protein U1F98_03070 [Verrucomicrobiota bacterium]
MKLKIENRQQLLIVVTLALFGLFIADRILLEPLWGVWKDRSKEIARLRLQVSEGRSITNRESVIRGRWTQMRTNTLPNNQSLAQEQVLNALVNWAQESGVSINGTSPQWRNDTEDYHTLGCHVDASGSLWALSRFLYNVEFGPMALKVESIDLTSHDASGQQLTLGLQISGLALTSRNP